MSGADGVTFVFVAVLAALLIAAARLRLRRTSVDGVADLDWMRMEIAKRMPSQKREDDRDRD